MTGEAWQLSALERARAAGHPIGFYRYDDDSDRERVVVLPDGTCADCGANVVVMTTTGEPVGSGRHTERLAVFDRDGDGEPTETEHECPA